MKPLLRPQVKLLPQPQAKPLPQQLLKLLPQQPLKPLQPLSQARWRSASGPIVRPLTGVMRKWNSVGKRQGSGMRKCASSQRSDMKPGARPPGPVWFLRRQRLL